MSFYWYLRVERTFSCPYSCLRLTGNICLPHSPKCLVLNSHSYTSFSLRLPPTLLFLCVGDRHCKHRRTGTLSRCLCTHWLLILTSCGPCRVSHEVKKEFVWVKCHTETAGCSYYRNTEVGSSPFTHSTHYGIQSHVVHIINRGADIDPALWVSLHYRIIKLFVRERKVLPATGV